jgi:hypothetical protein
VPLALELVLLRRLPLLLRPLQQLQQQQQQRQAS